MTKSHIDRLRANDAASVADVHVDPPRRQIETFGFCLTGPNLRDRGTNHAEAVAETLAIDGIDHPAMSEDGRVELVFEMSDGGRC